MDFVAVMDQVIALLRQRGRLTYRTLQRQFQLDDAALEDLKVELIKGQRLAVDEDGDSAGLDGRRGRHLLLQQLAVPTPAPLRPPRRHPARLPPHARSGTSATHRDVL